MISSFFRWTFVLSLLCLLAACARVSSDDTTPTHPGYGKGPLTAPKAAPAVPVQSIVMGGDGAGGKVRVGILLPLTGPNAQLGQAMLNAAQMAVFDTAPANYELIPRDTVATGAENAAKDILAGGAQLIIGPLFAQDVSLVRGITQPAGVALLSLSTDTTLKDRGVYVMGFSPEAQVDRIVSYAIRHGLKRFAGLVPGTPYGSLVGAAYQAAVTREGGTMVDYEVYNPTEHDSLPHIHTISMVKKQIDALFLPEAGPELIAIASGLSEAGIDSHKTRLLGTGLWDDATLGHAQHFLVGGWYPSSDPATRRRFVENYKKTYGQEPIRLTSLAYDATALSAVLVKRGTKVFDETTLTNPNGFAGLDGIFRLLPDGSVERGLAINELTEDGLHPIDPAPITFASSSN